MSDLIEPQLGNYRLICLLGKGGFADVYLGEHVYLKTQAAIKVLHTQIADDSLQGFIIEAQTIGRLRHPHIIRVLDFGVQNNTPFLVMDYAPKGTLRQLHPRGSRLPLPVIVVYVKQIAKALQYAHNQKLIHRDIKPENMLLGSNNEILLSDFGIATMAQSSRYQLTQEVVGTVSYMAPEQIQGKPRPASDEYALGIVIYEWLTGSCPFQGSFTEIATQHVFATPSPLREKLPTISPDVEQVLLMALAKDPQQRFATLQAFANAFEQACGRAAAMFSNTATFMPHMPFPPSLTPDVPQSELLTFVRPSVADPDPTHTSAPVPRVPAALDVSNRVPTEDAPPSSNKPPLSRHRYTRRMLLGGLGVLAVAGGGVLAWFMTSQGSSRAVLNPIPATRPAATATPSPMPTATPSPKSTPTTAPTTPPPPAITTYVVFHGPSQMYTVSWSSNATWIASAGLGSNVEVWSASSGSSLLNYNCNSSKVYSVAWSPDASRIASGHSQGVVQLWDGANGTNIFSVKAHSSQVNAVAWSPDGKYIVSGSADHTVKILDANTGAVLYTYSGHSSYVNALAWSHSGALIASGGGGDNVVKVWSVSTGNDLYTYSGHSSDILALAWSLNDTRIASSSKDTTVQVWNASNGGNVFTYRNHTAFVNTLAWSPDNTRIASGGVDTTVQVWSATTGTRFLTYNGHSDQVQSVTWSPDSTKVASASNDGTVRVWQAT
jgi:WD40 repeat protein